jgi:hypothetical protein
MILIDLDQQVYKFFEKSLFSKEESGFRVPNGPNPPNFGSSSSCLFANMQKIRKLNVLKDAQNLFKSACKKVLELYKTFQSKTYDRLSN